MGALVVWRQKPAPEVIVGEARVHRADEVDKELPCAGVAQVTER